MVLLCGDNRTRLVCIRRFSEGKTEKRRLRAGLERILPKREVRDLSLADVLAAIQTGFSQFRIQDLLDILIIAFVIFKLIQFTTNTRASQVLKGVLVLLLIFIISNVLNLITVRYLINSFLVSGILVVVVLFQPELRRALERIGRFRLNIVQRDTPSYEIVNQLCLAVENMSRRKVGALIVLERNTKLGDYVQTGTVIDAEISDALIENIFEPKTPLHDGAVILRDDRVYAAACVLPLYDDPNIARELGTRHRAALGISTVSDCITLVVSEETGIISYAHDGRLVRNLDHDTLEDLLTFHFNPNQDKGFQLLPGEDAEAEDNKEKKEAGSRGKRNNKGKKKKN